MGDLSVNLTPKDERKRASHAIALDIRKRLAGLPLPAARLAQGRRGSAGAAGALDAARRDLRPRCGDPARGSATGCARLSRAVDFIVDVDDSFGVPDEAAALRDRSAGARIPRRRGAGGLRHDRRADRGGTQVGYSQRGSGLKPIAINVALPRSALTLDERLLSTPLPAGGTPRQGANVELGDVVKLSRRRLAIRSSATTAASRRW